MPEKPMSLADEIMEMVEQFALLRESNIKGITRLKHREALHARLESLETELNDLRNPRFCDGCGLPMALIPAPYGKAGTFWNCYNPECYTSPIKYRTSGPPRIESHSTLVNGLPCSGELGNEDGG
jgi:hypothetical protein